MRFPLSLTAVVALSAAVLIGCSEDSPTTPSLPEGDAYGVIHGGVTAELSGDTLQGIVISLTGTSRTAITDADGLFWFDSVVVGTYTVRAAAEDRLFVPAEIRVELNEEDTLQAAFVLRALRRSDSLPTVPIAAGSFLMGNNESETIYVEEAIPRHHVTITRPFFMGATEITQSQWSRVMEVNPSPIQKPGIPVTNVTYQDVATFCNRMSLLYGLDPVYDVSTGTLVPDHTKNGFRLPTEAEWEFAVAAGDTTGLLLVDDPSVEYSNAVYLQTIAVINTYAWTENNTDGAFGEPRQVGLLEPNPNGLYDVIGNVQEMVEDQWSLYTAEAETDPLHRENAILQVVRGSSFGHLTLQSHSVRFRDRIRGAVGSPSVGFRIARNQ